LNKIGLLVWTSDLRISDEKNILIEKFLEKSSKFVENEINNNGGIGGKDVFIKSCRVPRGEEGLEEILKVLEGNPDIAFLNGHVAASINKKLIDRCNLDTHILFSSGGGGAEVHTNKFDISRKDDQIKIDAIADILSNEKRNSRLLYIHEGLRLAPYEKNILKNHRGKTKSFNFKDINETEEIIRKLEPILNDLKDDDVIILDVGYRVLEKIFVFLNNSRIEPAVIKTFGSIHGRFNEINFPLIEMSKDNIFPYLDLEQIFSQLDLKFNDTEKSILKDAAWRLELPYLVAYASRSKIFSNYDKQKILSEVSESINNIDGEKDLFIGKQLRYAFEKNSNIIKENYTYQYPRSLQSDNGTPKIYYPKQYFPNSEDEKSVVVNYINIDILRILNIKVGDGTWSTEFYLDFISPHKDPIDIVKFNNLSSINPKFESKLMWVKSGKGEDTYVFRYLIVANFDFHPNADNYPFDWQHIFISYSVTDQKRFGLIQAVPEALLDKEFIVQGWSLKEAITGVMKRKETIYESSSLEKTLETSEEIRVGWTLSRTNSITLLKIGIPLFFLCFLVYSSLYSSFSENNFQIEILTTTFLSAIALYFSTERPNPLRFTTIDAVFAFFYILNGVAIILTWAGLTLGEGTYKHLMLILKILMPFSFIGFIMYIMNRIRLIPSKIFINE
jgi:hypothetical protein